VIDDHAAVREGLKSLVRSEPSLEVVGEAADAAEGLRLARRHQPEVIVLDNEMPGGGGLSVLPILRAELPGAKIVMFSLDATVRDRALAAGATTFVAKDAAVGDILRALLPPRATAANVEDASDGAATRRRALPSVAVALLRLVGMDAHSRRVNAIAEATRALAGVDRIELTRSLLDAVRRVSRAEAAAVFANAAGDARLVSATRALSDAEIDSFVPLARDVMRAATARAVMLPSEGARRAPRAAALAPISLAGQEVRGVLVMLGHERAFSAADIALLRSFAQQIWMVMRSGPLVPSPAAAAPASSASPQGHPSPPRA
jgi:CheY-like chemotaxis protein